MMFKPMLATDADLSKLSYPILASPKLDGVRAIVRGGVVYSRSNKVIPNTFVQDNFKHLEHLDGELIFGDPTAWDCYRRTVSAVMGVNSTDGADVSFFVFDHVASPALSYHERTAMMDARLSHESSKRLVKLEQLLVKNEIDILEYEQECLDEGYEGLILRDPHAPYKYGRSTMKEGYLLKLKRFKDAEATVIGFEERMHNGNEATTNELGRTKRSSHAAGKTGRGDLGALVVSYEGIEFNIGTGFTDMERSAIWKYRDDYVGRLAKFKYFPVGIKEAPRHPVFLGWRDKEDT